MAGPQLGKDEAGNIWELDAQGNPVRLHSPAQPAVGPAIGGNPMIPGQLQGQALNNQKNSATLPYEVRKAAADASSAEIAARTAKENYDNAHVAESPQLVGLSGPALLAKLPADERPMIQGMLDGRMAPPTASALKDPQWQQRLKWANQVDPSFDESAWSARVKGRSAIVGGTLGKSQNALNTAIGHAASLMDLIPQVASHGPALGFLPTSHAVNAIQNAYERQNGEPGISQWDYNANQLANELEAAYTGGQGSEQGRTRQLESLNPNMSADQKKAVIHKALDLLASKVAANYAQYSWAFRDGKPTWDMLDPDARAALKKYAPDVLAAHFAAPAGSGDAGNNKGSAGPGFVPPPTGPNDGGVGPSGGGFNRVPDPNDSAFWNDEIRQGVPYATALKTWQTANPSKTLATPPDPAAYAKATEYVKAHPNIPYAPVQSILQTPLSGVGEFANDAAQTGPVAGLGHFEDSLLSHIPSLAAGDNGNYFNAVSRQQHPYWSTAGDIGGTVVGAATVNKGLGKLAPYLGRAGRVITANPMRQGLIADTTFGAGSGAIQNPDHPIEGAATGGISMAAGNLGGRFILGPALAAAGDTAVGQNLVNGAIRGANKARGMFGRGQAAPFAPPAPLDSGQSLLLKGADVGNPKGPIADIRSNLQGAADLGLPYSLADADPRLRVLAGSAVRKSPDVRALAEDTIAPRQRGQAERAVGFIDQHLAPVGDVPTMQSDILKSAQTQSRPLYEAAKAQPVPDLAHYPDLREVLDRPAGQAAIRKGYESALNRGEDVGTLTYATDPNGNPVSYGNPSWNVIHYARQALDQAGEADVRHALDKQISLINPGFKTADAAYSGALKGSDALDAGAASTGIRVTPEATQRAMGAFPDNQPHFQQGFASSLADTVDRTRLSRDPYEMIAGSPAQQQKLGIVFPQGVDTFGRARGFEGDMSRTNTELLGGSPTAARIESDKLFDNPVADGALELGLMAATGTPPKGLIKKGLQFVADGRNLGFRGAKAKADQIGPILLNTDPQAGLSSLDDLARINSARQAYLQRVRAAGGMFAAPATYGAFQQN